MAVSILLQQAPTAHDAGDSPPLNQSVTIPTGSNRIMLVWAAASARQASEYEAPSAITYDGVNLTKLAEADYGGALFGSGVSLWALFEADFPADGTTADVVYSYVDGTSNPVNQHRLHVQILEDAKQESPLAAQIDEAYDETPASVDFSLVTDEADSFVMYFANHYDNVESNVYTSPTSFTEEYDAFIVSATYAGIASATWGHRTVSGAATTISDALGYSGTSTTRGISAVFVSFNPAAGAGGGTVVPIFHRHYRTMKAA